jgi:3-dehydroquinate synthetase
VFAGGWAREHAIATCCLLKAAIVAGDERESGDRALLNLGHTFGHALEAAAGFSDRLLHGEAIALGMALAAEFSARLGVLAPDKVARAIGHLAGAGLPVRLDEVPSGATDAERRMV